MIVERLNRPMGGAVTLADVALHARADSVEFLPELQRFADAAALEAEDLAQIALRSQAIRVTLEVWPRCLSVRLPIGPLLDWSSVIVTVDSQPFGDFSVVTGLRPELRVTARPSSPIIINYTAGYGDTPETIPEDLRLAVMDQAACYFDARGPVDVKTRAQSPHFARITISAPAAVASGGVVIAGSIAGIAQGDAAIGAAVDVATSGVWELPKVAATAFTLGAAVYWDGTAGLATSTASGNTRLGVAVEAAAASTGTVKVRLSGF
ncbi:MAG: capsid cement protein [Paracoccus sp. (in: a-proteobacteria)]